MSTSPVDPQEIRAAAEVQRELGPEYSDAVVAAFIDRVDQAVEARVEARLAEERRHQPATRERHRTLLKGVALGVCAGALVAAVGIGHIEAAHGGQAPAMSVFAKPGPGQKQFRIFQGPGGKPQIRMIKPGGPPPPPPAPAPKS